MLCWGWDTGIRAPRPRSPGRKAWADGVLPEITADTATPTSSQFLLNFHILRPEHQAPLPPTSPEPRRLPAQPLCLQRWWRVSGSSGAASQAAPLQGPGAEPRAGTSQHRVDRTQQPVNLEPERLNSPWSDADLSTDAGSGSGKGDVPGKAAVCHCHCSHALVQLTLEIKTTSERRQLLWVKTLRKSVYPRLRDGQATFSGRDRTWKVLLLGKSQSIPHEGSLPGHITRTQAGLQVNASGGHLCEHPLQPG